MTTYARPSRAPLLPEQTHYADTGCSIHPACLSCPLERCRFDGPAQRDVTRMKKSDRDAQIQALKAQGFSAREIADQVGVNTRSVFRILGGG